MYDINLDLTVGYKLSNNRTADVVTIIPLTSNLQRIYMIEVLLQNNYIGLQKESPVQAQQIRTISQQRINSEKISKLNLKLIKSVNSALK
nr:type II toxin-antitoxin system PemK/MazF family toxin [Hyella patelloides]